MRAAMVTKTNLHRLLVPSASGEPKTGDSRSELSLLDCVGPWYGSVVDCREKMSLLLRPIGGEGRECSV